MNRIALFGGTFNPIHFGHLLIAEEAFRRLKLKKVFFIPCYAPPHKTSRNLASAQDRLAMIKMAVRKNRHFEVSDLEIKRVGKSYTVDTIREFKKHFSKSTRLMFIIGSDMLDDLKAWKEIYLAG